MRSQQQDLIQLENYFVHFVLCDSTRFVTLNVVEDEFIIMLGENGTGKSTSIRMLVR